MSTPHATVRDVPAPPPPPYSGRELACLGAIVVAAFLARVWQWSSLGLNQYDEGLYAFVALRLTDELEKVTLLNQARFFAPPVYYSVVAALHLVLGSTSDLVPLGLNVAIGTLTVALVWWVARRWIGPAAGLAAAALLALNEFHITFSRSGLTDIMFAFWFVLALALVVIALERRSLPWAIGAGLVVGVAWNTKYHGWFALLVAAGGLSPLVMARRWRELMDRRLLGTLATMWIVAIACYVPWYLFIDSRPGGYEYFATYQRRFVSLDWLGNARTQAAMQAYFDGPLSRAGVIVAPLLALWFTGSRVAWPTFVAGLAVASAAAVWLGTTATVLVVGLVSMPFLWRERGTWPWILIGWAALFAVMTPVYRPYARLLIPLVIALQIAVGYAVATLAARYRTGSSSWAQLFAGALVAAGVAWVSVSPLTGRPWAPASGAATVAQHMLAQVPAGMRVVALGEPAITAYLQAARPEPGRVDDLQQIIGLPEPIYLGVGVYAKRAPGLEAQLRDLGPRLSVVARLPYVPNDVRLVDDAPIDRARQYALTPDATFDITLYRLDPAAAR